MHPAANQYGERVVKIMCTGAMQFLKATETKIKLQENQRTDQIINALNNIFNPFENAGPNSRPLAAGM